ncbi:MAG: c-type cytochrome [Bacteroidetes bacterium]|nr:c-type cytochrome [Bacteroidota bacterium]
MVKHLSKSNLKVRALAFALTALLNLTFLASSAFAQDGGMSAAAQDGEKLFKANCTSCHDMQNKMTGPALKDVHTRRSEEWLVKWIRNNEKLRASGDKDAIAIFNEYNKVVMNNFESLTEDQVKNIIAYFKEWKAPAPKGGGVTQTEPKANFYSESTLYILLFLIVILLVVLLVLRRTKNSLKKSYNEMTGTTDEVVEMSPKAKAFRKWINPTIAKLGIGVVVLLALASYGFYFGVTEVAVQQGYAPEQPIKYSHKLHAGELQIDCKYCHSTAEYSKQASVPSLNTCMNCHKGVQLRDKYDGQVSPEIQKIYAAMDYDVESGKYGDNPKPIRWIRIHNLPDHAFFNHSMHVKGAGLTCQTCHGPIQEMEVVQQYATLQMGWCINCHRERKIDVENNPYYEKLHAKIKAEKDNKNSVYSKYFTKDGKISISPAENGALECSKCHY